MKKHIDASQAKKLFDLCRDLNLSFPETEAYLLKNGRKLSPDTAASMAQYRRLKKTAIPLPDLYDLLCWMPRNREYSCPLTIEAWGEKKWGVSYGPITFDCDYDEIVDGLFKELVDLIKDGCIMGEIR